MVPIIAAILRAKWKKSAQKHPQDNSEEEIQRQLDGLRKYHKERNTDVFSRKDTGFKGIDIEKIELPGSPAWLLTMDKNPKDKVVFYIHGGGFGFGCVCECWEYESYVVRNFGYNMCGVDYREIPEHNIRDILEDCLNAYKAMLERYEPSDICFMGDSAGGHLVFALSHLLKDEGLPLPGGIVALSPVMQFERYAYSYYECSGKTDMGITFGINERVYPSLKGDLDYTHKYVSPLCGDFSGFPSVYIDASDRESLRDDARMAFVKLKEAGADVEYHELEGFFHDQAPHVKAGYVRRKQHPLIVKFLNKVLG